MTGIRPSLVLDTQDHPHITYRISGVYGDLLYAWNDGSAWYTQTADAWGDTGASSSLRLDSQGRLHVGYYNESGCVMYAYQEGPSWPTQTVSCGPSWYGIMLSLALDSSTRPHFAFTSGYGTGDLLFAWPEGGIWRIETVDSAGNTGYGPSLALDAQYHPHIAYYDETLGALKYAWHDGTAWHAEVVDDNGYQVGHEPSMALDALGRPHISYYVGGSDDLRYAWFDGTWWQIEVVDTDQAGRSSSLALDAGGLPRISYRGGGNLRYARLVALPYAVYLPLLER